MTLTETINHLTRYRAVLAGILAAIPEESARWKPAPDRWSVLEVVNHLADIETEDFRQDLDLILHSPDQNWPSFDIEDWVIRRKYNSRDYQESVLRFLSARDTSLTWLSGLEGFSPDTAHSGKGFNGIPMRAGDVLASWVGHDIYHTGQLTRLSWDILQSRTEPFSPAYSGYAKIILPFNSPLSKEKAHRLMSWMGLPAGSRILDAGCGRGEFLIQMAESFGVVGTGIDIDGGALVQAGMETSKRLPGGKLEFLEMDITNMKQPEVRFDGAVCIGATHAFEMGEGAFRETIAGLRDLVKPGGVALIGEGYWKINPDGEYLGILGEPTGIYRTHNQNIEFAESSGCRLIYEETGSVAEWDAFETAFREKRTADAAGNASDMKSAENWWKAYIRWGRTTMGFGFYVLQFP